MTGSHLIIVYRVIKQKKRIPKVIDVLFKVLRMRKEWMDNNCTGVKNAENKNLFIMTLEDMAYVSPLLTFDIIKTRGNDKVIKRAIEVLQIIQG